MDFKDNNKIEFFFADFVENKSLDSYKKENFGSFAFRLNQNNSLLVLFPVTEGKTDVNISLENFLKSFPYGVILLNSNLSPVFFNLSEKKAKENLLPRIKQIIEKEKPSLLIGKKHFTVSDVNGKDFSLTVYPVKASDNLFGYACFLKDISPVKESKKLRELFEEISELSLSVWKLENKKDLNGWTEKLCSILHIKRLAFYQKTTKGFQLVASYPSSFDKKLFLSPKIESLLEKKETVKLNTEIYPIKGLTLSEKETFIFRISDNKIGKSDCLVISEKPDLPFTVETEKIKWLFKLFFIRVEQLNRGIKFSDIFEEYPFPAILVNADNMKIVYSNKKFKEFFGRELVYFNGAFAPESNFKLLNRLETEKELFSDYVKVVTDDKYGNIAKIYLIPHIRSHNKNFFAAIFKTQEIEITLAKEKENLEKKACISLETALTSIENYSFKLSKTKNLEKTINGILEDFGEKTKCDFCFIASLEKEHSKTTFLNFFPEKELFKKNTKKTIEKSKETIVLSTVRIQKLPLENKKKKTVFTVPFYTNKNTIYLLGAAFDRDSLTLEEKTFMLSFSNILSFAFEKKLTYTKLTEAEKQKERIDAISKEVISTISHEIKTPLTSILGLCELIDAKLEATEKEMAKSVKANALKLLGMLEAMLEMNKLKVKGFDIVKKREVNTQEFITSIENFAKGINQNPNVIFKLKTSNPKPSFFHDETILYRIAVNLIDNAFSHTSRGMVGFTLSFNEKELIMEIKDTGEGIPEENLSQIFTPFFQGNEKEKASRGHSGLGLYIVKQLCDIINAKIEVKSKINVGTYFKVRVPLGE